MLEDREAQIQAKFIDICLDDGIDKGGNVEILVDGIADARGADILELLRQGKLRYPSAQHRRNRRQRRLLRFRATDDDMVEGGRAARLRAAVGRSMTNNITARDQTDRAPREASTQCGQILRHGNVDRQIVRKQVGVPLIRNGHPHDLAAQQLGKRPLAP